MIVSCLRDKQGIIMQLILLCLQSENRVQGHRDQRQCRLQCHHDAGDKATFTTGNGHYFQSVLIHA
jgi:hypothetical protein